MSVTPSYAVITPTRNEEQNLARLGLSMTRQNLEPRRWVIVDNGSTDGTAEVARQLAEEYPWITLLEVPGEATPVRGAPIVRAFHAGVEALDEHVDAVVKLDADVSFEPDFFERMMSAFERDPSLGITGGLCVERNAAGSWVECHVTRDHVRGATRAYRWECLQDVLPLEERIGWDGVDELKAQVRGWRTRTLQDIRFYHHRRVGMREPKWGMWLLQGDMAHFMGYRPYYVLARSLYRSLRQPSAVAMLWGFGTAVAAGTPRCTDAAAIAHLRRQQSMKALPRRIREALGKGA